MRRAIAVLGTGRCGTSAVCSVLDALGVPFGQSQLPADLHNPSGYFEDRLLIDLNTLVQSIKQEVRASIDTEQGALARVRRIANAYLSARFAEDGDLVGMKEPRGIMNALGAMIEGSTDVEWRFIWVQRNATETAHSWNRMRGGVTDGEQYGRQLSQVQAQVQRLAAFLRSRDNFVVKYEELTHPERCQGVVAEMASYLGLDGDLGEAAGRVRVKEVARA